MGIDQKYFLPLPQNFAQLPREYSQPSEFEYLTDFYERYPEKRTTPAPDVASNYRRLDLFLDQNNGILNLDRVTENMCAIDPRWCEFANLDFEVRGNKNRVQLVKANICVTGFDRRIKNLPEPNREDYQLSVSKTS